MNQRIHIAWVLALVGGSCGDPAVILAQSFDIAAVAP
jgi:hypothetical protein